MGVGRPHASQGYMASGHPLSLAMWWVGDPRRCTRWASFLVRRCSVCEVTKLRSVMTMVCAAAVGLVEPWSVQ